jgi:hypothetical protein
MTGTSVPCHNPGALPASSAAWRRCSAFSTEVRVSYRTKPSPGKYRLAICLRNWSRVYRFQTAAGFWGPMRCGKGSLHLRRALRTYQMGNTSDLFLGLM